MSNTEKVTIGQIIDTVRAIAAERPNTRYLKDGYSCSYTRGPCDDGTVGCIFGQAFQKLGFKLPIGYDQVPIHRLLDKTDIDTTYDQAEWCRIIQNFQDSGDTWADAIKTADSYINN